MKHPIQQYRDSSPALRTAVWFTICNILQRGTSLIVVPIFTRLLTTAEYGICNVYFAWFDILILFTSLKLPYEGLNNGLIRHESDKDAYTSSILGLITVLTGVAAILYSLLHHWLEKLIGLNSFLMAVMFVQLLFQPFLMLWTNRERFDFRYRWPVVVTLISTVANPILAIFAVTHTSYMAEARILASAAVQIFFGLLCAGILLHRGRCVYRRKYWRFALRFNLPLLAYYLSQSLLNQSDRIMINYFAGSGQAAIYSVAYTAATLMLLVVSAVNGSLNPWMYRKLKAKEFSAIAPVATQLCLLLGGATFAMMMFAPDIVAILATPEYQQAIWIIPPVAASVFFVFVYMLFSNVELFYGETHHITHISILSTIVNLVLNALLIPMCGYLAAAWTTLFSYLLLTALHYLLMKRACRRHEVPVPIFHAKLLFCLCIAVVLLAFIAMALYRLGIFRYIVIVLEGIVLFLCRDKLRLLLHAIQKGA